MNFLDNVVKSSNALLKERLSNPFGGRGGDKQPVADEPQQQQQQKESKHEQQPPAQDVTGGEQVVAGAGAPANEQAEPPNGSQFAAIAADAEAVAQKAAKQAKDLGSFLFSMANRAGATVSQTAKQVKQAVESTSLLGDLTREQQEFLKQHGGHLEAAPLPWCEYAAEPQRQASVREQILGLSQDRRNFVRNPPPEANFQFDPQQCYPVALALLKEDSNLSKMRFELVPKLVNEDTFWRNYFYRLALLRQMIERGEDLSAGAGSRGPWASSRSSSGEGPDEEEPAESSVNQQQATTAPPVATSSSTTTTTAEPGTTTAAAAATEQSQQQQAPLDSSEEQSRKLVQEADELQSRLKELDLGFLNDTSQDDDKWEEELQKDLQEFELVDRDLEDEEEPLDKEIAELFSK